MIHSIIYTGTAEATFEWETQKTAHKIIEKSFYIPKF